MGKLRINWGVVGFFVFYFFVLQFFNDWQYRRYLDGGNVWLTLKYRLWSTPFTMFAYYLFYRWGAPLLFKRKFGAFLLSIILFIIFLEFYSLPVDWIDWRFSLHPNARYPKISLNIHDYSLHQSLHFTLINLFAITGFAYFIRMFREEKIKQQLRDQHLQLELKYLKAQLQPHFFFNTLNNIYSLALYRSEKTAPIVEKLSLLMRYIIYEGQKDVVPLETEIEFLKNFVALEKIRHEDGLAISFTVQGNADRILIPPLLFMPLLENGFKHGVYNCEDSWLEAEMLIENNEIIFGIRNSIAGSATVSGSGIGLDTLRKRLALLYPKKHELLIQRTDSQFEVNLTLRMS
jgi:sensor histidine kinase YesM